MKTLYGILPSPPQHWVGDGFPVRSLFSYSQHGQLLSPFLLFDRAGPYEFAPARQPRGVGEHPHRGFETVTIVYSGEVEHLDSTGSGGKIGPGDVQWMTAGSGIQHQEFHSPAFTEQGGVFSCVQLWVNLPARDKMSDPGYQTLLASDIPNITLPEGGVLRLIAGELGDARGPAQTFSPMNVWDLRLTAGQQVSLPWPDGFSLAVTVLEGSITLADGRTLSAQQVATFQQQGEGIAFSASEDALVLLLGGQPLNEPIAGYGPFVMNTREEIEQAMRDYRDGQFARVPAQERAR